MRIGARINVGSGPRSYCAQPWRHAGGLVEFPKAVRRSLPIRSAAADRPSHRRRRHGPMGAIIPEQLFAALLPAAPSNRSPRSASGDAAVSALPAARFQRAAAPHLFRGSGQGLRWSACHRALTGGSSRSLKTRRAPRVSRHRLDLRGRQFAPPGFRGGGLRLTTDLTSTVWPLSVREGERPA